MSKMKVRIEFDCELLGIARRDSGIGNVTNKCELEKSISDYIDWIFKEIFVYHEYDLFEGIYNKDNILDVNVNLESMPKLYSSVCEYLEDRMSEESIPGYR